MPVTYIDKGDVEDRMRACVSNHLPPCHAVLFHCVTAAEPTICE